MDILGKVNDVSIEKRTLQEVKNKWKKCQYALKEKAYEAMDDQDSPSEDLGRCTMAWVAKNRLCLQTFENSWIDSCDRWQGAKFEFLFVYIAWMNYLRDELMYYYVKGVFEALKGVVWVRICRNYRFFYSH